MDLGLEGKNAYVTGGALGIGKATCDVLLAEGANVIVADLQEDLLHEQARQWAGGRLRVIAKDLSTREGAESAARSAFEGFSGPPDIVVNNVGAGKFRSFEDTSDDAWIKTFELNLFSVVRTCRILLPEMFRVGGGSIVNVASDLARQPEPVIVDYAASKAAILSLSKSLALQYAPQVRVNSVCPGPILTPFWSAPGGFLESIERQYSRSGDEALEAFIEDRHIPMGRMGTADDVARAIVYLASPASSFITGGVLGVDGGTVRALA
jgi:NAD(P)-dependent dehydrogenase (short-subunit alcohol dehydrogenase family)